MVKTPTLEKDQLVWVKWEDACTSGTMDWINLEDEYDPNNYEWLVESVGTVINSTDTHLQLAMSKSNNNCIKAIICIPVSCIKEIKFIKLCAVDCPLNSNVLNYNFPVDE